MNFFQRRKVLKGANYLELTPVHRHGFENNTEGMVSIHVPRFENKTLQKYLSPRRKKPYVNFHLDSTGSKVWLAIDGSRKVAAICEEVKEQLGGDFPEGETRVARFLTHLYLNKMITFKEIEG